MSLLVVAALAAAFVVLGVARAVQNGAAHRIVAREDRAAVEAPVVEGAADPADAADSEADAEPEPEPEPVQEPVEFKLMMIGDLLMHEGVIYSGQRADGSFNYDHLFAQIASDITEADVAMLNQETILGGTAFPYSGYPVFNTPQELGDAEVAAGFDVILKATNHTLDLGYDGVRVELAYWAQNHPEMAVIGMADPDGDGTCPVEGATSPAGPAIVEKDGLKVAILNYTEVLNGNVDWEHDWNVIGQCSEEGITSDVKAAREAGADFVVVVNHWGAEYVNEPTESERYWAEVCYGAGVDVVVGGHPHVIQPVEVIDDGSGRKMLVFWSVGNFVSSQPWASTMVGGMAKATLIKDADGCRIGAYEFIPVINQRQGYTTYQTAYKLCDYTDELAAASDIWTFDGGNGSTAAWYQNYCASVLGDAFDWDTMSVHGSVS